MTAILSLGTLPPIALPAQHLAIIGNGATALFPWGDVVGLHLLYVEMFATDSADALLTFIDLSFRVVVEGTDAQVVLVAV